MNVRPFFPYLLIFMASAALAQQSSQTGASISDRDKAGLRGPVKTVLEEDTFSRPIGQQVFTTTTEYSREGRILKERWKNSDGSESGVSYTYYSDGRLLKTVAGNPGKSTDGSETTYLYDDARRLIGVKSGDKIETRYQYDEEGHKSAIKTYDSQPLSPDTAYAGGWEGIPELGFRPSPGGFITTLYNEQGVATGAQFHDAEGNLVGHVVRKFDEAGRVTAEEQAADSPQLSQLPEELRSKLNPEQIKSVGAMIAGEQNNTISYFYDGQGRVKERHRSGVFGEQVTVTTYNDHGDKDSERETTVMRQDTGPWSLTEAGAFIPTGKQNPSQPPSSSETRYTYQYDQYGNWTEQTILGRFQPDEEFRPGTVIRRKLTYY